jgi:hypothetical protein
MTRADQRPDAGRPGGIRLRAGDTHRGTEASALRLRALLAGFGLAAHAECTTRDGTVRARLRPDSAAHLAPGLDTTGLACALADTLGEAPHALERETLCALLLAPDPIELPGVDALESALRVRLDTVAAARDAALAFDCDEQRPPAYWTRDADERFVLRPGCCLIDALREALLPSPGRAPHAFGCYRATEYVMLLAIAREAARTHPALLERLAERTRRRPIQSREFHDVLLREHGTMEAPLPARWFVPGDRVWFRNPDERSADAAGFEGSWVIYLGGGLFGNFWERGRPFTLTRKCVEIHHWRDATWTDRDGRLRIDEELVARRTEATLADPRALAGVLERMQRWRDPRGVYAEGGCLDRTREWARAVPAGCCDIAFAPA